MRVEQFLERTAARLPHKIALICGDRTVTYGELDAESLRVARLLQDHGLRRGDRVAVYLENSVEAVVSIWAVLRAGAVFVMVNPTVKPGKLAFLLNNSRATALISDNRRLRSSDPLWSVTSLKTVVTVGHFEPTAESNSKTVVPFSDVPSAALLESRGCIDLDLAAIMYTSGSSGRAKGVMLTHLNIVSAATSIIGYLQTSESDVVLNALPLSFDYGLYQVLMTCSVGATLVLERSFTYPHAILELIARERVTAFPIVPTIAAILLQLNLDRYDLSSLRYVTSTGAALPVAHIHHLRKVLPRVRLFSMYGLTECKRVSYLPPDQVDVRPDSVGRGMPNEEVYLIDEHGLRLDTGIGELVVRGAHVMKGYWELPEETDRVLKPGPLPGERVLLTGDIFRMDDEGYLYFLGRRDDIIKSRGEKVSPREVENVLYALEGIAEAAVIGVPDAILGQAIKAIVTLRHGATLTPVEILRHCARHLEDYMVPKVAEILPAMPKTATGKIAKQSLREPVAG